MASNSWGKVLRLTTWGESHGTAIGAVLDGFPAGLSITREEIQRDLDRRRPGYSSYTSPRREPDYVHVLSGLFEGKSTGTPISLLIGNENVDSAPYEEQAHLLRPGHAHYSYWKKYGLFDFRGGGRASARETALRVAAGTFARKLLQEEGVHLAAFLCQMGKLQISPYPHVESLKVLLVHREESELFCPDLQLSDQMGALLEQVQREGDSVGGAVSFLAEGVPAGWGDPVYEKLESSLAAAMLSIPASKGFEIGRGFEAATLRGSEHNDLFIQKGEGEIGCATNHAGGVLGGISTGQQLWGKVAFKPTSSLKRKQKSLSLEGKPALLSPSPKDRHDPCLAIRAVPVVEAMLALVLADSFLLHQATKRERS